MLERIRNPAHEVTIGFVGKYVKHRDAYKCVYESLDHAGIDHNAQGAGRPDRVGEAGRARGRRSSLAGVDGLLVPGGFDKRGIEGKIEAIRFARETGLPFFGICLGPAVRDDRVRPQRGRAGGREQHRVQQGDAAPGRLPARRAAEDHADRRDDAARGVRVPAGAGTQAHAAFRADADLASGTGTATR